MQESRAFLVRLPITNTSDRTIRVKEFDQSCDCVAIQPASLTLQPRATAMLSVTLDLARAKPATDGGPTRDFGATVRPILEGEEGPSPAWPITGRVTRWIELSPSVLNLGEVRAGTPSTRTHVISVRSRVQLKSLTARCDPEEAVVHVIPPPAALESNESTVEIQLLPWEQAGPIRLPVEVEALNEAGVSVRSTALLVGMAVDDFIATPETVHFGAVPVGEAVEAALTLTSRDTDGFVVRRVECDGDGLDVKPVIESSPRAEYRVRLRVNSTGSIDGRLRFEFESEDGGVVTRTVRVNAYGTAAASR